MATKTQVYADWAMPDGTGLPTPKYVGELTATVVRNKELFSFNTDDHLRNHGFILDGQGWRLSPAYDINPVTPAQGLHLNITESDNQLDVELAMDVIDFFRVKPAHAKVIRQEVSQSVHRWAEYAKAVGISRPEQERMAQAFRP